jgi:capsular polysaccharide transport system permease protein
MLMSPFVDAMEMMRGGIWGDQITVYYSIWNPLGCSLVTTFFGLALCRKIRRTLAVA